jgi:hypothetical protein
MRKHLLLAVLSLPALALAQVTPKTSETKVESTTTTPSTTDSAKTEKTVKQKSDGSSSTVVEHTAKHDAPGTKSDKKTHSKSTVEKDASGTVTKTEATAEKK